MIRRIVLIAAFIPFASMAAALKPGFVACTTESGVTRFVSATLSKDERAMRYMLGRECVVTNGMAEFPISVLERESYATKIRVYTGGNDALEIWTSPEAVTK